MKVRLSLCGCMASLLIFTFFSGCTHQAIHRLTERSTLYGSDEEFMTLMTRLQMRGVLRPDPHAKSWNAVHTVLRRLVSALNEQRKKRGEAPRVYRISVVEMGFPNAFSLPNGQMFITSSMIDIVDSEHALAGVLGHEIGHAELEHYRSRLSRTASRLPGLGVLASVFDQEEELEADRFGIDLANSAGYSPRGYLRFFKNLETIENRFGVSFGGFLKSHPATSTRVERIRSRFAKIDHVEPPRSSQTFLAMKRDRRDISNRYRPLPVSMETPPRFRSKNQEFNRDFKRIVAQVQAGVDELSVEKRMRIWAKKLGTNPSRDSGALHAWIGRYAFLKGNYRDAMEEFALARRAWPQLETLPWLEMLVRSVQGQTSQAASAWKHRSRSQVCVRSLECLRMAVLTASQLGVEEAMRREVRETYRRALEKRGDALAAHESDTWSRLIPDAVEANLLRDPDERKERLDPRGFRPSPEARDWLTLEAEYIPQRKAFPYREQGSFFEVGGGVTQFGGDLNDVLGTGATLQLAQGFRKWPWGWGVVFGVDGTRTPEFTGAVAGSRTRSWTLGLFAEHLFGKGRFRPFMRGEFAFVSLSQLEPDQSLSTGWKGGLRLGGSYRLAPGRGPLDLFLRLSGGLSQHWLRSFLARSGNGLGWQVGLDLLLFTPGSIQADLEESEPRARIRRQPPDFF